MSKLIVEKNTFLFNWDHFRFTNSVFWYKDCGSSMIPCSEKGPLKEVFIFSPFSRSQIKVIFAYFCCLTYLADYFFPQLYNHNIRSIFYFLFLFFTTSKALSSPLHKKLLCPFMVSLGKYNCRLPVEKRKKREVAASPLPLQYIITTFLLPTLQSYGLMTT